MTELAPGPLAEILVEIISIEELLRSLRRPDPLTTEVHQKSRDSICRTILDNPAVNDLPEVKREQIHIALEEYTCAKPDPRMQHFEDDLIEKLIALENAIRPTEN